MRRSSISAAWPGRAAVVACVVAAAWALNVHGQGVSRAELGVSWQVLAG